MRLLIGPCLLAALMPGGSRAQALCSQTETHAAARRVKDAQIELLAYNLNGDTDEEVPALLQGQIRAMKDALAAGVDAVMQCAKPGAAQPSLESSLVAFLVSAKPPPRPIAPNADDFIYGKELRLEVTMPQQVKNLALIELHFDIECGIDSLLLGYEQREGEWQRVLRWQSGDYDSISGAFGDFFKYVVIPR